MKSIGKKIVVDLGNGKSVAIEVLDNNAQETTEVKTPLVFDLFEFNGGRIERAVGLSTEREAGEGVVLLDSRTDRVTRAFRPNSMLAAMSIETPIEVPLETFLMKPVSSSNIKAIGYNEETKTLFVHFLTGTKYRYHDVEKSTWVAFEQAESVGKFHNQYIKGRYQFTKDES